jgi:hypothetical protein
MDAAQAERFAACLTANERFTAVSVAKSDRAKGSKQHFVSFQPASEFAQNQMLAREIDKRQGKADDEGRDYLIVLDKNLGRVFAHCYNPISQETHELDLNGCSCGDWTYRGRAAGVPCKHMRTLESRLRTGEGLDTF